eukprot:1159787-Pelagomonas_calceolata.AAC.7
MLQVRLLWLAAASSSFLDHPHVRVAGSVRLCAPGHVPTCFGEGHLSCKGIRAAGLGAHGGVRASVGEGHLGCEGTWAAKKGIWAVRLGAPGVCACARGGHRGWADAGSVLGWMCMQIR